MQIKKDFLSVLRGAKDDISYVAKECSDPGYLDNLVETAMLYKLVPNILSALIKNEYGKANKNIIEKYKYYKKANAVAVSRQVRTIKCLDDILQKEKIVWIKGLPLSKILYDDASFRNVGDIDFLVEPAKQRELVALLESKGFKKIGIINDDMGLRYSVHYHEIQLVSPYNILVEIKTISGEMDIFKNEDMMSDFVTHTEQINICGKEYETLDYIHTLVHLFLSAFSNSTTWFDVKCNGIRDLYEIVLFCQKYEVDYKQLYFVSNLYGMCFVVLRIMKKINNIFDKIFPDSVLSIFANETSNRHTMDKLYESFEKYYDIGYIEELFAVPKKKKAYFDAISKAYYLDSIQFMDSYLISDILEYSLIYAKDKLKVDLYLDSKYVHSDKEALIFLKFLCNNEAVIDEYGYIFSFWLLLKNGNAEAVLRNQASIEKIQHYKINVEPELIEEVNGKTHFIYYINPFFLNKNDKKICFNIQLGIQNENDQDDFFIITTLCPQKNTLPIYHIEDLSDVILEDKTC